MTAILHLLCGKIAAGKSTLSKALAAEPLSVLVSEDDWMPRLFPENRTIEDYIRTSARLREAIGPHIVKLLCAGMSVVLDFPANTRANREWMRGLFEAARVPHQLHYLEVSDQVCLARMHARNATGEHPYNVTDEQFAAITSYFDPPHADEGFALIAHRL